MAPPLGLNMRIFDICLLHSHTIAMGEITEDMAARLDGLGSMPMVLPGPMKSQK